jgi:hypothetical protein
MQCTSSLAGDSEVMGYVIRYLVGHFAAAIGRGLRLGARIYEST